MPRCQAPIDTQPIVTRKRDRESPSLNHRCSGVCPSVTIVAQALRLREAYPCTPPAAHQLHELWPTVLAGAMTAVIARSQEDSRTRFRCRQQESLWNDFMRLQMDIMHGMNEGIAYLARLSHEHISVDAVVVLGPCKPVNALEVIDLGRQNLGRSLYLHDC